MSVKGNRNSKDEDDLLNEDLADIYVKKMSDNIVQNCSDTLKILQKDTVHHATASTSNDTDRGDQIIGATTSTYEVDKDLNVAKAAIDNAKAVEETKNFNDQDDCDEEDNLELRWDEDDGDIITPDDVHKSDDDFLEEELLKETDKDIEEVSNEPCGTESNLDNITKESEDVIEERLLKEPVGTLTNSEQPSTDGAMELNEDELLNEEQPEDSEMMDVDTTENFTNISETVEEIVKSLEDCSETVLKSVQENTLDLVKANVKVNTAIENTNLGNREDSGELNLSVEVETSNISIEKSPILFKTSHSLSKPDVMLEIPTQELIDIDDVLDSPNESKINDSMKGGDVNNETVDECDAVNDSELNQSDNVVETDDALNKSVAEQTKAVIDTESKEHVDSVTEDNNINKINDPEGTKSKETNLEEKTSKSSVEPVGKKAPLTDEATPSTSAFFPTMTPDTAGEVPEVTDHLGLLAESFRVMDEDDDQDDEDDGDPDEDDDFDHDESSNQMTAEHSEDSSAQHSETEPARVEMEREIEDREADDIETETNQCEEDFIIDEVDIDEEGINEELSHELKKEEVGINEVEDDRPLLPELQVGESNVKVKEEKGNNSKETCVEVRKDNEIKPQNDTEKEREDTVQLKLATSQEKEEVVKSKDVAVNNDGNTVISKDVQAGKDDVLCTIKQEKEDVIKTKRTFVSRAVLPKIYERVRPRASSTSSNDDVIEQFQEIETVKVSDDEDDEPSEETQENLQQDIDMTPLLEKSLLDKTTVLEKIQLIEKVKTLEKTAPDETTTVLEEPTALDETAEVKNTTASETIKSPEKIPQPEETSEPNNSSTDLAADQAAKATGSKTSPKSSPAKLKTMTMSSVLNTNILNIVELGESSSEDDLQEPLQNRASSMLKNLLELSSKPPKLTSEEVTTVNIPTGIDIMSTSGVGGNRTQIVTKAGEVVISGVPKPPPQKPARLNTSEVTIKTASSSEQTLIIPEAKVNEQTEQKPIKPKLSLEIFSLDSDEEESAATAPEPQKPKKKTRKCINSSCSSGLTALQAADVATAAYYDATRKKKPFVCQLCADAVLARKQNLVAGIKDLTPLLQLDMSTIAQDLVEILDSDSEDDDSQPQEQQPTDTIGEETAKFLEENLADLLNDTWKKYNLDERLKETQDELNAEILKLEEESKDINQMLVNCQLVTDKLRSDLYATFEHRIHELPPLLIFETSEFTYIGPECEDAVPAAVVAGSRLTAKRKIAPSTEIPAKRPAIPLGYTPLENCKQKLQDNKSIDLKIDDDKDISVVKLSAESAPADLPPPGELTRSPLRVGMSVYAMKNAFGPWFKSKILEILPKVGTATFTTCRVKFDHKVKNNGKILPARCLAYAEPADVRMTIGTRLIALFKNANKRESYYSGVVSEIPTPVNNYRYLVFFDDGYAQYVDHAQTRVVCECSPLVWEEVHPLSREFVREYLMAYPERPMVRLHEGQHLKTEWDGKWWNSLVSRVDASLAQVVFIGDGRREWIYRGSTRLAPLYLELQAAERHRPRPMPRSTQPRSNMMPYVEYTRSDEQASKAQEAPPTPVALTTQQQNEEIRRQRAVAKKSTAAAVPAPPHGPPISSPPPSGATPASLDSFSSRVVYYTPKHAVRPLKLVPHKCSPKCKRNDLLSLKELRTYNPLAKPLLSGWERQIVRFKGQKEVMYRAPCGRRLRNMRELHRYLRDTDSELPVDLFDFYHATHCLAEFVLSKCLVGKKDLSHGKENVPVPCVNYYDDSLPEFCSYNTERTPTSGVPLNLDPEFLCGCDCTDDCEDKTKCACWKLTLEGARTIGLEGFNVGYEYKRLPEPLPSGIYECNSRCKCKQTCLNRVAQHPLQLKLQVFKTLNRGWGIRALNDVPKGSFLCVYAGNLLTDATANLDGLNEGDEYLAELDYIEVVEQMKEGYEEDIPNVDKRLDKSVGIKHIGFEDDQASSSEDENTSKTDKEDDDFRPGCIELGVSDFNKHLRARGKDRRERKEDEEKDSRPTNPEDDCITISDDDEVREPSRFTAKPGMSGSDFISKYRSVRTLFGEDEACYIMDAKVQGNIGRYLNHSCSPNVFVQNVFVDTHDPRFPWVAFFALSHIKAGTELTWNYNYDVGSVPGKVLYCYCEAPNCRGRLL